ncbi:MAG: hypothetical protein LW878_00770 [Proteobacteria bacterium]|jgi:myosin heavy subunit|nr:hypothetical protein [Pseudomonadota bacterium]
MGFDYQKLKAKHGDEGSFWTSYSDLFMVLCVVFLLLYVVASLRSGTSSVQQMMEQRRLKAETQDLKKQLQAYNALKDDYIDKEASEEEAKMYEELMSKLSLLQDEAHEEKRQLEAQAQNNAAKADALNQYQQMVRNIINTNMLSKKKVKLRDDLIVKKNDAIKEMDTTITQQNAEIQVRAQELSEKESQIQAQLQEIDEKQKVLEQRKQQVAQLQSEITDKSTVIQQHNTKIKDLNQNLASKIKELEKTYSSAESSKTELNRKIVMLKLENAKKVSDLQAQTKQMNESVSEMNQRLSAAAGELKDANSKLAQEEALKAKLQADLEATSKGYEQQMADMKQKFNDKLNAEKAALEGQLEKEKASAQEKLKRLGEFKDKMAKEKLALDGKLSALKSEINQARDQLGQAEKEAAGYKDKLAQAQADHGRYLAAVDKLQKEKDGLSGDLKRAQELANAKKMLANKIAANLAKNGIKAGVDGKTGDVTINFGDEYFDTGRADLKGNMKEILQKFVPTYSKSLLEDPKVAKEISSVEIIGFSSPTYKGRYIDPQSLKDEDKTAISYNLDLSYNRAKSIFSYIFDKQNMIYQHQKELLPLVKVTGRSFLAEEVKGRDIASGLSHNEYCAKFNCEKSQKVIIKFNLKD